MLLFLFKILLVLVIVMEEGKEHVMEEPVLSCFTNREMVRFSESWGMSSVSASVIRECNDVISENCLVLSQAFTCRLQKKT